MRRKAKPTFEEVFQAVPDAIVVAEHLGKIVLINLQAAALFGYAREELVGRNIEVLIPQVLTALPQNSERRAQRSKIPSMGKHLNFLASHKDGGHLLVEVSRSALRTANGLLIVHSIRDNTERRSGERDLHQAKLDAQARAEELSAVLDAAPAMTLIARDPACRVMTGGRVAYDLLRLPYGINLSKSAPQRDRPNSFRVYRNGRELRHKELPIQTAAATGREVRDSELTIVFANGDSRDFLGNAAPLLNADGTSRGAVGVFVDITERKLAERSTRELYARMLRLQDDERRRIARELHDSVGQNLAGLVLSLGALKRISPRLDPKSRRSLAEGLASAREAAQDVRTLSRLLHPPLLHEFGLLDALRTYVRTFSERSGIKVSIRWPSGHRRVNNDVETTLFRVVQEALTNIYRHSGSKRATVRMRTTRRDIVLEVRDFGRGMEGPVAVRPSRGTKPVGIGLPGIRERLQQFGGELEIHSSKRGTLLRALLPCSLVSS